MGKHQHPLPKKAVTTLPEVCFFIPKPPTTEGVDPNVRIPQRPAQLGIDPKGTWAKTVA